MNKLFTLVLMVLGGLNMQAQESLNMELLSNLPYSEDLSDVWGYVAPNGDEYAIVGTRNTASIVDLRDPSNPIEVASFPGNPSTWRDMKQFGEFAYVTNDTGADGLLVINMSGAPGNITGEFWQPEIEINGSTGTLGTCHNIFIDDLGYGYLSGCNLNSGGVLIIDLFTTPGEPQFVSGADPRNSHDVMVQDNLMYSSDIFDGFFSVVDVSDRADPITLATQSTTMNFTHNAWVSADNNYLFTTDERANAYVDSYDISDLTDIRRLDSFRPGTSIGSGSIPHNTHFLNGYLVTSWYTDGVRIIDGNRPQNMVEVAFFDTFQQNGGGFQGAWGATPFLPSGRVLVSDINSGLYVFDTDYVRAAYLEGNVTDASTGMPLDEVEVVIDSPQINSKETNPLGDYKTGLAEPGQVMVTFSKFGFRSQTVPATIERGEVTILDVALVPSETYNITGTVRSLVGNNPIENAKVLFQNEQAEIEVATDADGVFVINSLIEGEYDVFAGAWLYENIEFNNGLSLNQNENLDILLDEALMDDFIVDLGWTVEDQAQTGAWVRVVPTGTTAGGEFSNPNVDVPGDVGNKAYVTGNSDGGVGDADIDGGIVRLNSPVMDLTTFISPSISYSLWFVNTGGQGTPNDSVAVQIMNGIDTVDVELLLSNESNGVWRATNTFLPEDFVEITNTMQFSVVAGDNDPGHLVEAGLDQFLVLETAPNSTRDLISEQVFQSNPNPFSESTTLNFDQVTSGQIVVRNVIGQLVETIDLESVSTLELGSQYEAGVYLISLSANGEQFQAVKVIKQ